MKYLRAYTAAPLAAALAVVTAGCGSGSAADAPKPSHRQLLRITLTDKGCSPTKLAAKSGRITFVVANGGTSRADELEVLKPNGVVLGEKEDIVGMVRRSFTVRLGPGHYILACPIPGGGGNGTLVVTGRAK